MSHNTEQIRGNNPNVSGEITATLDKSPTLGIIATQAGSQQMTSTGNYSTSSPDNYYIFFAGNINASDTVSVSSDTITISDKGTYYLRCCPSFGAYTGSLGNQYIRMQFVDENGNGLGNIGSAVRNTGSTYPPSGIFAGIVQGHATVKLEVKALTSSSHFPKNTTESTYSQFFLEVIRIK